MALMMVTGTSQAADIVITCPFGEGVLTLSVDDNLVDPDALKRYLVIHPVAYDGLYHVSPGVQLCVEGEVGYRPCGTRDVHAEHFLGNADHNLQLVRERLSYLDNLKDFPDLQPLVDYFRSSLRFGIWLDERLVAYYRTWDPSELKRDYEGLPIIHKTRKIITALERAQDPDSRWQLSYYEWQNRANRLYRNREGAVPAEVWSRFVKNHKIAESIEWDEVD